MHTSTRPRLLAGLGVLCLACCSAAAARGEVVVSELMAATGTNLTDADGDPSDWIELYNVADTPIALAGWSLTDDPEEVRKWPLPDQELGAGEFLIVFASGKDRRAPDAELHTNFKLSRSGEFLGLANPLGQLSSTYAPRFPAQRIDGSFGLPMGTTANTLLPIGAAARILAPENRSGPSGWTELDFDDSEWLEVTTGIGFDRNDTPVLGDLIATDVYEIMQGEHREPTGSVFLRIPFALEEPVPRFLQLQVNYDSGFIAFLNGVEVARRNAARLRFNVRATQTRPAARAARTETIDLPSHGLRGGRNILAVQALNNAADSPDFLFQPALRDVAVTTVEESPAYFEQPSPGRPNGAPGRTGIALSPRLSRTDALFSGSLALEVTTESPTATIYYTTDGSDPDDLSPRYERPLELTAFTTVKARAFDAGLIPSEVATGTYVAAFASIMDFDSDLPLVVVSSARAATESPIATHVRIVEPGADGRARLADAATFAGGGTLKTRGSSTLGRPKKSYSFELQDAFGRDRNAPLLSLPAESDWVLYGPHQDGSLLRNVFMYGASNAAGRYAPRTRFCELFAHRHDDLLSSAAYAGVYVLIEKIKRGAERVDVEKLNPEDTTDDTITGGYIFKRDRADPGDRGFIAGGESLHYVDPKEFEITDEQATWLTNYIDRMAEGMKGPDYAYRAFIDVDSWIDHHLMQEFSKNADAFEHSTYYHKRRGSKLEVGPVWDFNYALGHGDNAVGWTVNRKWLWWGRLLGDATFLDRYVERWVELRRGAFQTVRLLALLETAEAKVREAQVRNFERWVGSVAPDGWAAEVGRLRAWIEERLLWMDDALIPAPRTIPSGGRIPSGTDVRMESSAGTIFYTLSGVDPRGDNGAPHPDAVVYDGPITVTGNIRVQARIRLGESLWGGRLDAAFITDSLPIVISEIMYNPGVNVSSSAYEFIEFRNVSDSSAEIGTLSFDRRPSFNFANSEVTTLRAGEYAVIVNDLKAFSSRYDTTSITVLGEFSGTLSNNSQTLRLLGPSEEEVFGVHYEASWHPSTDGKGHSLVLAEEAVSSLGWSRPEAWQPSEAVGGSPGRGEPTTAQAPQRPSDWNQDNRIHLIDAVGLLRYLAGTDARQPCAPRGTEELADADGNGRLDLTDALHLLNYIFQRGPAPARGLQCVTIVGCPAACREE